MTITVLGTEYEIKKESYEKDELFEKRHIDGYCDDIKKVIVVCDMKTHPLLKEEEAPKAGAPDAAYIEERIAARAAAKKAKNYAEADRIRSELAEQGVTLIDTPAGTTYKL